MTNEQANERSADASSNAARKPTVALLTFHFVRNFGGVWQAYGLAQTIKDLGGNPNFVDYQPSHVESGAPFRFGASRSAAIANLTAAYQRGQRLRSRLFGDAKQAERFKEFRKSCLPISSPRFNSIDELRSNPPAADAYIVGSDQIWHRSKQFGFDPTYYLDFPTGTAKRYSYAASFGSSTANEQETGFLRAWLSTFDGVSVREHSGMEYVRQVTGMEASLHCDPSILQGCSITALASECNLERFRLPDRHVAVYALRSSLGINETARFAGKQFDASVIEMHSTRINPVQSDGDAFPGPIEWVAMLMRSKAVVTNSFHGTIFSILFQRPFVTLSVGGKKTPMDDRVRNLLRQCGLESRFCQDSNAAAEVLLQPIDWQHALHAIESLRDTAKQYLSGIIAEAKCSMATTVANAPETHV